MFLRRPKITSTGASLAFVIPAGLETAGRGNRASLAAGSLLLVDPTGRRPPEELARLLEQLERGD